MNLNRLKVHIRIELQAFRGDPVVRSLPANAGGMDGIPSPGGCTYHRATGPLCCNYGACALEPLMGKGRGRHKSAPSNWRGHPAPSSKLEKSLRSSEDPAQPERDRTELSLLVRNIRPKAKICQA